MSMAMGPTAPEPATEGKDLSGGFFILRYANNQDSHKMRVHVAPFTNSSGTLLYSTPPSGLFSDADPTVTAAGLIALLQPFYTADWTFSLDSLWQMVSGQPQEVFPIPSIAAQVGTGVQLAGTVYSRASQITLTTRDTAGSPFKLVLLGSCQWAPYPPGVLVDNANGTIMQKLVHYLANNGAIRSHAGNKPLAPFRNVLTLNNRLRREYHQR